MGWHKKLWQIGEQTFFEICFALYRKQPNKYAENLNVESPCFARKNCRFSPKLAIFNQ
jgi:hypothetical protein